MKLGFSSYTFGWAVGVPGHTPLCPLDEQGLLDRCAAQGVKLLQVGDNLPLHTFDDARLHCFAERAARDGIQIEVGARGLTLARVVQYAAIARRLGATLIRLVIDDTDYHPEPETVVKLLLDSVPLLSGLTLGLENHDRFPAATMRGIIEGAGSDRIGVCLDTANSLGAGEGIEHVVATLAPLTVNLHIKDFAIERLPWLMGFTVTGRPAGGGMLDLPALLRQLAPHGRCASAILELWTPPESALESTIAKEARWAQQSLEYLKPLFARDSGARL